MAATLTRYWEHSIAGQFCRCLARSRRNSATLAALRAAERGAAAAVRGSLILAAMAGTWLETVAWQNSLAFALFRRGVLALDRLAERHALLVRGALASSVCLQVAATAGRRLAPVLDGSLLFRLGRWWAMELCAGGGQVPARGEAPGRAKVSPLAAAIGGVLFMFPFLPTTANTALIYGLALLWLAESFHRGRVEESGSAVDLPVLVLLLIAGGAALGSVTLGPSLVALTLWLSYALLFFLITRAVTTPARMAFVLACIAASAALVSAYGLYQAAIGVEADIAWLDLELTDLITTRVFSVFDNPNLLAEYLGMILPVTGFLLLRARGRGGPAWARRLTLFLLCALYTLALVYTYSRGGWVGALAALAILLVALDRRFLVLILAAALLAPSFLPQSVLERASTTTSLENTSNRYRVSIWTATIRLIRDYWLYGVGLGPAAFGAVYPDFVLAGTMAAHSHNLYLQLLAEMGVLGLGAFLWLVATLFRTVARGAGHHAGLALAMAAGVAGQLIYALAENIWYSPKTALLFWAVMALAVSARAMADRSRRDEVTA